MVKRSKYKEVLPPELLAEELKTLTLTEIARKYKLGIAKVKQRATECGIEVVSLDDRLKLRPPELYIALERHDLSFTKEEMNDIKELWKAGINIVDMATKLKRDELEVAALIMDLADSNRVQPRKNGALGDLTYEEKACIFCGEITSIRHFNKRVCKGCIETLQREVQNGEKEERTHHPGTDTRED